VLSGRGPCDELITPPEESYRLRCVVVRDLETSRIGAPCIYDISSLRVNSKKLQQFFQKEDLGFIKTKSVRSYHSYTPIHADLNTDSSASVTS